MSNATLTVARKVAARLLSTEDAIDTAIQEAAGLAGFMPVARQEARASVNVGQDAIEQILVTMTMLAEARRSIAKTHAALAEAQERVGLRERNFGGFVDKPRYHQAELTVVPTVAKAS
jgi:hypothetical protein